MLDWILRKLGLVKAKYCDQLIESSNVLLYDIAYTYEQMNELLDYNLSPEGKAIINNYLAEHDWITEYDFKIYEDYDEE